ncbi:uncharacterized protein LOC135398342 [Ornithodoros turicata]|uniref:uncharacterized protein LOC135398342 n=1 Tax=Ornithodoros turicata TaxID=34597 RepID=UPI003139E679
MCDMIRVLLLSLTCISFASADVDRLMSTLKTIVHHHVQNEELTEKIMAKLEDSRECFDIAKDINQDIMAKFIDSLVPTSTMCAARAVDAKDEAERKTMLEKCFKENVDSFKKTSGMTKDEMAKFDKSGDCIEAKFANFSM